ncbi:MAG: hypothetical protein AAF533_25450 [Acidobacteriota bacterium]
MTTTRATLVLTFSLLLALPASATTADDRNTPAKQRLGATPAAKAATAPAPAPVAAAPTRRVIMDSRTLRQKPRDRPLVPDDLGTEEARDVRAINATRGTWQSYLAYTTPEIGSAHRPGFTWTLPPPRRTAIEKAKERERRAASATPAELLHVPQNETARKRR